MPQTTGDHRTAQAIPEAESMVFGLPAWVFLFLLSFTIRAVLLAV